MINQEADQIHGGAGNGVLSRDDAVFRGERLRKEINNDGIFLFINILWNNESRKTQIPHVQRDNWILQIYFFFNKNVRQNAQAWNNTFFLQK